MENRTVHTFYLWSRILLVLLLTGGIVALSSGHNHHMSVWYMDRIIKSLLILLVVRLLYTIFVYIASATFQKYFNKSLPHFGIRVFQFIALFSAVLSITVFVLDKSIFSLLALGGVVGAGIALGIGPIILDAFSGLAHEAENSIEMGDWVKLEDGREGKVISSSWRSVRMVTTDKTLIVFPHRKLSEGFTNLSRPESPMMQTIQITVDHTIPVERAQRIILAATIVVPQVYDKKCSVGAVQATEGGMVYDVRYQIKEFPVWREAKHAVFESITRHLHDYGLKVSETLGEYALSEGGHPYSEYHPLSVHESLAEVDLMTCLSKKDFEVLCKAVEKRVYRFGDIVIQQGDKGDSLFFVAEGVLDVFVTKKGMDVHVATLGKGEYVGEKSFLMGEARSATVKAATPAVLFEIHSRSIAPLLKTNQKMIQTLAKVMHNREDEDIKLLKNAKTEDRKSKDGLSKIVSAIQRYFSI